MSLYLGTQLLAGVATNTIYNAHTLLDFKWTDHLLNDQSWLRADTYSWQDGTVYSNAYQHLVDDIDGKTATTETVNGTTVTYYLADDGHKIVKVADVSAIETVYGSTGVAWYYVLDTTNQRFKLPRENPNKKELKISAPVMADHTKTTNLMATKYGNILFKTNLYEHSTGSVGDDKALYTLSTVESPSSDFNTHLYSDLTGGQGFYQGKKYLYFYVGQFSQSATEQTAGLNAELFNGKADVDLSNAATNASVSAKQTIVGWGMPGHRYIDLTLGASGTEYTAPANGWFVVKKVNGVAEGFIQMANVTNGLCTDWAFSGATYYSSKIFIPAKKGDVVNCTYNLTGETTYFRFVYSEGEV